MVGCHRLQIRRGNALLWSENLPSLCVTHHLTARNAWLPPSSSNWNPKVPCTGQTAIGDVVGQKRPQINSIELYDWYHTYESVDESDFCCHTLPFIELSFFGNFVMSSCKRWQYNIISSNQPVDQFEVSISQFGAKTNILRPLKNTPDGKKLVYQSTGRVQPYQKCVGFCRQKREQSAAENRQSESHFGICRTRTGRTFSWPRGTEWRSGRVWNTRGPSVHRSWRVEQLQQRVQCHRFQVEFGHFTC